jgi:hypothetical protein
VRWYINDASLQDQYPTEAAFIQTLQHLMEARARFARVRKSLYTTRSFGQAKVVNGRSVSEVVMRSAGGDLRRQILLWVTARGPFIEDERLAESDDYFECLGMDVSDGGAGEAARRVKAGTPVRLYTFVGGPVDFCINPLPVDHGLDGDRLARYEIVNCWTVQALAEDIRSSEPSVDSWRELVETGRERYEHLLLPDAIYENAKLAAEPFENSIAERALQLLRHLNEYMTSLGDGGVPSIRSNEILRGLFTNASGAEPPFTGESTTNQKTYASEMTFPDPENSNALIFAHWHGKIRHRFFRMHFEWPLPAGARKLKVLYLGPKLTKS